MRTTQPYSTQRGGGVVVVVVEGCASGEFWLAIVIY